MVTCPPPPSSASRPPAGSLQFLLPPVAPARPGGVLDPLLWKPAGDEGALVAVEVPEARVTQGVGCHPGGQVEPAPQLDHLRRRAEPGLPRVLPPEALPRRPADPAQLLRGEPRPT